MHNAQKVQRSRQQALEVKQRKKFILEEKKRKAFKLKQEKIRREKLIRAQREVLSQPLTTQAEIAELERKEMELIERLQNT